MRFVRLLPVVVLLSLVGVTPAAAAECSGADLPPGSDRAAVRTAVVCLSNQERTSRGLEALASESRLESAAQRYAEQLVGQQFFAHVSPSGKGLTDRLSGYTDWLSVGENLAWGEGSLATPRAIVASWMASPGHRANLLSGKFTEVGIGAADGAPTGSILPATTFAAEYGTRQLVTMTPPAAKATKVLRRTKAHRRKAVHHRKASSCHRGAKRRSVRVHGKRVKRCVHVRR